MDLIPGDMCEVNLSVLHKGAALSIWNTAMYMGKDRIGNHLVRYIPGDLEECIPHRQARVREITLPPSAGR